MAKKYKTEKVNIMLVETVLYSPLHILQKNICHKVAHEQVGKTLKINPIVDYSRYSLLQLKKLMFPC